MNPFDIVIVTNSAGELSAYVKPTVEEISKSAPEARVFLVFTPCQFATGREMEEAKSFPGVYEIILPEEYKKWVFKNKSPQGVSFNKRGVVLFMGGDLLHAMIISRKLRYRAIAYSQKHAQWRKSFSRFLVPDDMTRRLFLRKGVPEEKIRIVGDLMVDSVPERVQKEPVAEKWKINLGQPVVSFLPGSRPFQTDFMVPFFLETAQMMQKIMPEAQLLFIISPYLNDSDLKRSLGDDNVIYSQDDIRHIQSKGGARIKLIRENRHEVLALSTLAITIPGTNTAEIAALGTPMVVVLPLNRPEAIPFEGAADLLFRVPVLGMALKRLAANVINARTKFFALPNMKTGRMIAQEVRGNIHPKEVASIALKCLRDRAWLEESSRELIAAMGPRGASKRIAEEILAAAGENA